MTPDEQGRALVVAVECALEAVDGLDGGAHDTASDAIGTLVDLYGVVLARMLDAAGHSGASHLVERWRDDELVGHVLVAHALAPMPPDPSPAAIASTPVELVTKSTATWSR